MRRHCVGVDDRRSRVFDGLRRAAIFEVQPGEVLPVPAYRQLVSRIQRQVALGEIGVLVQSPKPAIGPCRQIGQGLLLVEGGAGDYRHIEGDHIRLGVALAVIIEEEEDPVPDHRPTHVSAKLIEVVGGLAGSAQPA